MNPNDFSRFCQSKATLEEHARWYVNPYFSHVYIDVIYIYIYIYVYQGLNYVFLSYIFRSQLVREAKTFMESGGRLSDSADRLEIMFKSCDVLKNMPGKLHFDATHTLPQVYYLFINISYPKKLYNS